MPKTYRESVRIPGGFDELPLIKTFVVNAAAILGVPNVSVTVITSKGEITDGATAAFNLFEDDEDFRSLHFQFRDEARGLLNVECSYRPLAGFPEEDRIDLHSEDPELVANLAAALRRLAEEVATSAGSRPAAGPLDTGSALLEPITRREYEGVEAVLSTLWEAVASGDLSDGHRAQIQALAEVIASEHRDTEPGHTPRWRLVGVVRSTIRYLAKADLPRNALAWKALLDVLVKVDWPNVAALVPQ